MTDAIAVHKRRLRAATRAGRAALSDEQRAAARDGLTAHLIELVEMREPRSLSCFMPTRFEPDTRDFLVWAQRQGIDTLLPSALESGELEWIRPSGVHTVKGAFGIDEPVGERLDAAAVAGVDLMLVPAAGVDVRGNRLGWGRGYFDRCIASLESPPPVFAVVFDHELIAQVPTEPHDVPVTGVVTPERVVVC